MLATTDRPHSMGIAQIDGERVTHFVEKPERPLGNLASVGWWLLGPAAVSRVLDRPVVNIRGEVEISGTLARAIEEQLPVGDVSSTGSGLIPARSQRSLPPRRGCWAAEGSPRSSPPTRWSRTAISGPTW